MLKEFWPSARVLNRPTITTPDFIYLLTPMSKTVVLILVAISLTVGVFIGRRLSFQDPQVLTLMPHHNLTACGHIMSSTDESIVLREYDLEREIHVEHVYQVPRSADLGSWESLADADPTTPVSVLYSMENDGTRIAERIHGPDNVPAGAEGDDFFCFGKVVEVSADTLTIREYDFTLDADVNQTYKVTPSTEYGNVTSLAGLRAGDDVVLDYQRTSTANWITVLVKEVTGDEEDAADLMMDH